MWEAYVNTWVRKIPCSRKWQPVLVFLPGKFHGQRSLVGYGPWAHKRVSTWLSDWAGTHHSVAFLYSLLHVWASLVAHLVKSVCTAGDLGSANLLGRSPGERKRLPAPVFLPREFHGQRSLAGQQSVGLQRAGLDHVSNTFSYYLFWLVQHILFILQVWNFIWAVSYI